VSQAKLEFFQFGNIIAQIPELIAKYVAKMGRASLKHPI
jgi:hypothetical protein